MIDYAIEILTQIPHIEYQLNDQKTFLSIPPKNEKGYKVGIEITEEDIVLYFEEWKQNFDKNNIEDLEELANYFRLALSKNFRLKAFYRRENKPFKYTLQYRNAKSWENDKTLAVGFDHLMFWKSTKTKYFQNDWISLEQLAQIPLPNFE